VGDDLLEQITFLVGVAKLPKIKESEFQNQVIKFAKLHGWRVAHFRPARTKDGGWRTPVSADGVGFPDLVMIRGKSLIVAELKVPPGELTDEQAAWLLAFNSVHDSIHVFVWTPHDWPEIEHWLGPAEQCI
jgi:hypothetical protein